MPAYIFSQKMAGSSSVTGFHLLEGSRSYWAAPALGYSSIKMKYVFIVLSTSIPFSCLKKILC